jgi:hypothetical protein
MSFVAARRFLVNRLTVGLPGKGDGATRDRPALGNALPPLLPTARSSDWNDARVRAASGVELWSIADGSAMLAPDEWSSAKSCRTTNAGGFGELVATWWAGGRLKFMAAGGIDQIRGAIQTLLDEFQVADSERRIQILKEIEALVRDLMHLINASTRTR